MPPLLLRYKCHQIVAVRFIAQFNLSHIQMRRKDTRLKHYDYKSDGYYFITLCTAFKRPLLQQFEKTTGQILSSLPKKIRGVTIDYYEIMPTHLHVILIFKDVEFPLGEIIRRYKALVTKEVKVKPFWEWNYYEHIIRSEKALYMIRKYIQENREKERINLQSVYV